MRAVAWGLIVVGLWSLPVLARDIHVSNVAGDDRFNGELPDESGTERSGPVRTIGKALRLADAGDRIVLANTGQPYRESIALATSHHSGLPTQRFALVGNGAILDGSLPVPSEAWEPYAGAVFRFRPRRLGDQMLFLDGRPAARVAANPQVDAPPDLEPLQWCDHRGTIYFCVEKTKLPGDYPLTYAAFQTGITLIHCRAVTISDLTVQGFQVDGISAFNSATDVKLIGLTVRGNARAGLSVGPASQVLLNGCLIGDNGEAQLLTQPDSETHIHACNLLGNTADAWVDQGGTVTLNGEAIAGGKEAILVEEPQAP